jgi:glycosyltransferase involved in cell wall biosynthesis
LVETQAKGDAPLNLCLKLKSHGFMPDVIYGHSGWGSTWFIKDVFPEARFMAYYEWYYNPEGADSLFGRNRPVSAAHAAELRMKNSVILNDLMFCDLGLSPTEWQRSQFPKSFQAKIVQLHDGVDTDYFRPNPDQKLGLPHLDLSGVDKIVTYVSRGMEPYRGFPQFIESLPHILKADKDCHVVIVASDRVCYGKPLPEGKTYKDIMLEKVHLDLSRVHFVGTLPYGEYKKVLESSSVHVYLTRPFVLSWSLLEAMACGCVIVASDTEPVREVIRDGVNGILTDFFSPEDIANKVLGALTYPSFTEEIRKRARATIEQGYALKDLLPRHIKIIEQVAHGRKAGKGPFG